MDPVKVMLPFTRFLSKNNTIINTTLFLILFLFISNTSNFFIKIEAKEEVKQTLKNITKNPWFMALITLFIFSVFLTGDIAMLTLSLYIVHIISFH
jgi:hypothetical protein|tara:strand:+ start:370 stop:657 length:288 start_codon:yes stop_codon:yes gene_type:complete